MKYPLRVYKTTSINTTANYMKNYLHRIACRWGMEVPGYHPFVIQNAISLGYFHDRNAISIYGLL